MVIFEPVNIIILLLVGLVAGWLAAVIVRGSGLGMLGDIVIGIVGAFVGAWVLSLFGIYIGGGVLAAIINATIGAIILLLLVRLLRRA